jgi:hypothetical protein
MRRWRYLSLEVLERCEGGDESKATQRPYVHADHLCGGGLHFYSGGHGWGRGRGGGYMCWYVSTML